MAQKFKLEKLKIPKGMKIIIGICALAIIVALAALLLTRIITQTAELTGLKVDFPTNCTDSDGGNNEAVFGSCKDGTRQTHSDTCVLTGIREPFKLKEYTCKDNKCASNITACQEGFSCVAGQCIKA